MAFRRSTVRSRSAPPNTSLPRPALARVRLRSHVADLLRFGYSRRLSATCPSRLAFSARPLRGATGRAGRRLAMTPLDRRDYSRVWRLEIEWLIGNTAANQDRPQRLRSRNRPRQQHEVRAPADVRNTGIPQLHVEQPHEGQPSGSCPDRRAPSSCRSRSPGVPA